MNTKLRILVDEDIEDEVADAVCSISAFNSACVRDIPAIKGKPDGDVMKYAQSDDRIVLTMDGDYNKRNYPICQHKGIIRIESKSKHKTVVIKIVEGFVRGGNRSKSKHAITILTQESYRIEDINGESVYAL